MKGVSILNESCMSLIQTINLLLSESNCLNQSWCCWINFLVLPFLVNKWLHSLSFYLLSWTARNKDAKTSSYAHQTEYQLLMTVNVRRLLYPGFRPHLFSLKAHIQSADTACHTTTKLPRNALTPPRGTNHNFFHARLHFLLIYFTFIYTAIALLSKTDQKRDLNRKIGELF